MADLTAQRSPFVWVKLETQASNFKVRLKDVHDVADLSAATALSLHVSVAFVELFLVAPPSLETPQPAAFSAALRGVPLSTHKDIASAGVFSGCWLVARVSTDALTAALALAAKERQTREAAEAAMIIAQELADKKTFMAKMLSISSAGSGDTASYAEEGRRGAPLAVTVPLERVLDALPAAPSHQKTSQAWNTFASAFVRLKQPVRLKLDENKDVHPTIGLLLSAALGSDLRLWSNALAEDDVAVAKVRPDFTVTHARDAMPSTIGALLLVEVKLPGDLVAACAQARIYLRRSIHKRCTEADARGEGMESIFAYALATDGTSVVALKMRSGAPPPGTSFAGATPCPVVQSQSLPLLNWNFIGMPPVWSKQPHTKGFEALHRLCAAPAASLAVEVILTQLSVRLLYQLGEGGGEGGGGGGGAEQEGGEGGSASVLLALNARLGCGGSSDVYACTGELAESLAVHAHMPFAAKVSRFATELVQKCFVQERAALLKLVDAAAQKLVPTLIATGVREGGASWPLLLLQPCGQSLPSWVAECVKITLDGGGGGSSGGGGGGSGGGDGGGGGGGGSDNQERVFAARATCASTVGLRLLQALEAAHAASLVHCDVRPSNIVVVRGAGAMLVDWGISRTMGTDTMGCGVAAYADSRVFEQGTYQARPVQDVIGLLLTWLCVAHSELCDAPWPTTGSLETMYVARKAWLKKCSSENAAVKCVVSALDKAVARQTWAGDEQGLYALAREALRGGV